MIISVNIVRVHDGLALCASTDISPDVEMRDCQYYIKLLSRKLNSLADRCTLHLEGYCIHLISAVDIGYIILTEKSYPEVLAFSFLDETQKEFLVTYDNTIIQAANRPYKFIEFESFVKRLKQRYNSPRTLSTRVDLTALSTELKLRPSILITEDDINQTINSSQTYTQKKLYNYPKRFQWEALGWREVISFILNVLCALVNLIRGMAIISHGHYDDIEDIGAYRQGSTFLLTCVCNLIQIFILVTMTKNRHRLAIAVMLTLFVSHFYLHVLRNWQQIAFHGIANIYATYMVLYRKSVDSKRAGYSV